MKAVTEAINSSKDLYEHDIVGTNVAMTLRKITENQRIFTASLITDVLKQGLLRI